MYVCVAWHWNIPLRRISPTSKTVLLLPLVRRATHQHQQHPPTCLGLNIKLCPATCNTTRLLSTFCSQTCFHVIPLQVWKNAMQELLHFCFLCFRFWLIWLGETGSWMSCQLSDMHHHNKIAFQVLFENIFPLLRSACVAAVLTCRINLFGIPALHEMWRHVLKIRPCL